MKKRSSAPSAALAGEGRVTCSAVLNPTYFKMVLPLVMQSLLTSLVNATDSLMLGRLSQEALAAVTLACQLSQIFNMLITGLCVGCTALQAQYYGNHDSDSVHKVTIIALQFSLSVGLVFFLFSFVTPEAVMKLFTNDPALIELGVSYLRTVSFSYFLMSLSQISLNVMKNTGKERLSAIFGGVAVVLNIILNYLLIYGSFGFPALGVKGAAVATTVARGAELLLVLLFILKRPGIKEFSFSAYFRLYRGLMRKFIRYTVPTILQTGNWMIASTLTMAILGHMSSDIVAAGSVASIVYNVAVSPILGITSAMGITLGQLLGKGEVEKAKRTGDILWPFTIAVSVVICLIVLAAGPLTFPFFNTLSDQALEYLKVMVIIIAVKCIGRGINHPLALGVFAAGGDILYLLKMDIINMWLVILPVSFLAAFVFRFSPILVYLIINLDEFTKIYHMIARYFTYIWAKNLTIKDWAPPGKYDRQIRHQIIDEMPLGVMVISNSGRIVLVNEACAALLGKTKEEIEGGNYKTLFLSDEGNSDALSDLFIEAMNDKTTPKEADLYYPNGESGRRLHIRASYMEDEDCRIGLCVMLSEKES